ncbi:hypothetical protein B7C51_06945 [Paenibacillus larvae subsp. pulvifaciens]|uniref:Uncharacterized protein n=1 Tax=Paenibacillus larvae subsp. pulvifaciens TaxID=1477 RepID=A0A1V0UQQ3_9BACL|nr:hypothetical protein [Paenibacillus larvae]ARF67625.1 hypothetical protein B7C51_06945 [Paenibacillus larvae subsp. pulvifaciens]
MDDEVKDLKSLENKIDYKDLTINSYGSIIKSFASGETELIQLGKNTKLVILTSSCRMCGELMDDEPSFDNTSGLYKVIEYIRYFANRHRDKEIAELEQSIGVEKVEYHNISNLLHLKDVTVIPFSNPQAITSYEYFAVFSDQVVGLSLGEVQNG